MGLIKNYLFPLLPESWVAAIERDSRDWKVRCKKCGETNNLWDLGGMRGKSAGKIHWRRTCAKCGERSRHEVVYEPDTSRPA
jgi:hypothetical protein